MNKKERNLFFMAKGGKELFRVGSIVLLLFSWIGQGKLGVALIWLLIWILLDESDRRKIWKKRKA
jgi:hypothetical protein